MAISLLLRLRFRSERLKCSNMSPLSPATNDTIKLCIWVKPSITPISALMSKNTKVIAPKGGCQRFSINKMGNINTIVFSRINVNPLTSASSAIRCANKVLELFIYQATTFGAGKLYRNIHTYMRKKQTVPADNAKDNKYGKKLLQPIWSPLSSSSLLEVDLIR